MRNSTLELLTKQQTRERLRRYVKRLQSRCSTPLDVEIRFDRTRRQLGCYGETSYQGRRIHIALASDTCWPVLLDTLIHEWAHAACWTPGTPRGSGFWDHTRRFGEHWAACYRAAVRTR